MEEFKIPVVPLEVPLVVPLVVPLEEFKIPVVPLVVQMMVRKRGIQESTGGPFDGPHNKRRYLRLPFFQLDCNLFIQHAHLVLNTPKKTGKRFAVP